MNNWYAAHLVLYVNLKDRPQRRYTVWENIVLIKAASEEEAFEKAEKRGKADEGDDSGTFLWGGQPARWVFAGIRKLALCEDSVRRPDDGTEVSYNELELDSEQAVKKLVQGQPVAIIFREQFAEAEK